MKRIYSLKKRKMNKILFALMKMGIYGCVGFTLFVVLNILFFGGITFVEPSFIIIGTEIILLLIIVAGCFYDVKITGKKEC